MKKPIYRLTNNEKAGILLWMQHNPEGVMQFRSKEEMEAYWRFIKRVAAEMKKGGRDGTGL